MALLTSIEGDAGSAHTPIPSGTGPSAPGGLHPSDADVWPDVMMQAIMDIEDRLHELDGRKPSRQQPVPDRPFDHRDRRH